MQKWEYLFVTADDAGDWRPRYVNGKELSDWKKGQFIYSYFSDLGEKGWELVGTSYYAPYNHTVPRFVFKRPKE